jgi:uncharacterized membrane protein (DUF106 family)
MFDISVIPSSTLLIMSIAVAISFINMGINRLLISRMCGWEEYRRMQKEVAEFRAQQMAALRAKDVKLMEKLKKKEPQIMSMQAKMSKPTLVLFPISLSYILIWLLFLTPFYGAKPVAYLPGFGPIPVVYWYFICSSLFGTLASRLMGVTPVE